MKNIFIAILSAAFLMYVLCSCSDDAYIIQSKKAVDTRYTPAYDSVETDTKYEYNWYIGEFQLVPDTHTVKHNEKFEVRYNITYENGSTKAEWCEVDKETYNKVIDELPP